MSNSANGMTSLMRVVQESSTEEILASQGDGRHAILADTGTNRYLNRYAPEPGLVSFGSCTSSTISEVGFAAAERLHGWTRSIDDDYAAVAIDDLFERVRIELISNVATYRAATVDTIIAPSGTDAEFIPLLIGLAGGRRVTNIVVAPSEVGSGTVHAAGGLHFDDRAPCGGAVERYAPVDAPTADRVQVVRVDVRNADGNPRSVDEIDAEVADTAAAGLGRGDDVLVHLIAHSKTGLHAPSIEAVERLSSQNPGRVLAVVDAAQGRFSRSGLDESLGRGWMTILTGSKFLGGPPFAGAVLVPHSVWEHRDRPTTPAGYQAYFCRSMLPAAWASAKASLPPNQLNLGLLLRWTAALAEIRDYYSVPARLRFEVLQRFQARVPALLARSRTLEPEPVAPPRDQDGVARLLESNTTVFPFTCHGPNSEPLTHADLAAVRTEIRSPGVIGGEQVPGCEIGQPVALSTHADSRSVLRLALGARDITRTCVVREVGPTFADRLDRLDDDVDVVVRRISHALDRRRVPMGHVAGTSRR